MGIYLDNAATSYPKPDCVLEAMRHYFYDIGANAGRSAHKKAQLASRLVFETREMVSQLIGAEDSSRLIFTQNATEALNLAILGVLQEGDHVITTSIEHNSVIRPLSYLKMSLWVKLDIVQCSSTGELDPDELKKKIRPKTKLIVVNHASNVLGTIAPIREIGRIARQYDIYLLVDAAQTAGFVPVNVKTDSIDMLAFSGHKGLLGPQGIGCLYINEGIELTPLRFGGTGSDSASEIQPHFLPDKYESGTQNLIGIAGLGAAVVYLSGQGIENHRQKLNDLTRYLIDRLSELKGITIYGTGDLELQAPVLSINVEGIEPSEVGLKLDKDYDVAVRVGLHCSPLAHKTMGTFPKGTVRISPGPFNTREDVDKLCQALSRMIGS